MPLFLVGRSLLRLPVSIQMDWNNYLAKNMLFMINDPCRPPFKVSAINTWHAARDKVLRRKQWLDPEEPVKIAEQWSSGVRLDEPLPPAYYTLVNAFNEERDVSFLGYQMMKRMLAQSIKNRILIKNYLAANEHIAEEPIEKPCLLSGSREQARLFCLICWRSTPARAYRFIGSCNIRYRRLPPISGTPIRE